jgi:hypothetical protein
MASSLRKDQPMKKNSKDKIVTVALPDSAWDSVVGLIGRVNNVEVQVSYPIVRALDDALQAARAKPPAE